MLADRLEGREEALGMPGGFEAAHRALALACRLMRILCPVVEALVLAVVDLQLSSSLIAAP